MTFAARQNLNLFVPVTNTYTTGSGATETVPAGATRCVITCDHGGAAGGRDAAVGGDGGGGSGRAVKSITVIGGNTFTYTVAAAVAGRATNGTGANGLLSSVTGTVQGGTVNLSGVAAGGGVSGGGSGGTAGTASGGDTNTAGGAGGAGGGSLPVFGGTAASGAACPSPGASGNAPGAGGGGVLTGTSGAGARGQVSFAYT